MRKKEEKKNSKRKTNLGGKKQRKKETGFNERRIKRTENTSKCKRDEAAGLVDWIGLDWVEAKEKKEKQSGDEDDDGDEEESGSKWMKRKDSSLTFLPWSKSPKAQDRGGG